DDRMIDFLTNMGLALLLAAVASAGTTGIVTWLLRRSAILDQPNHRSSHTVPTPRGGGWGVMLILLPTWLWGTTQTGRLGDISEMLIVLGAVALITVSWLDDRRGLGAGLRFATQAAAVGLVMLTLPRALSLSGGYLPLPIDRLAAGLVWLWFVN